ncbi:MAG TPA: flagellar basal body P-ring protein FlgI [Alphaproteobacteria bacterium]
MAFSTLPVHAATSRIKDIVAVEGVRDNLLVGYGLVVGLNGTGDSIKNSPFTEQSLIGMLERLGVNVRDQQFKTNNVAAVMVTATLKPFVTQGERIDISISALGDASDLKGGTLLVTPLLGADGEVYAVGQGPVATGAIVAQGQAESVTQNVPTSGRISNGAIVEREIDFALNDLSKVRLSLRNPDFTTAKRIAETINRSKSNNMAVATDPSTVHLTLPSNYKGKMFDLITDIEQLQVSPDTVARIVVDEKSGVIVMGDNVRISEVAIAQGNLTIRITETPQVSQPQPFSTGGTTQVVPRSNITVDQNADSKITVLPAGVTIQELVSSLNALGVGPRDIITILQSIKASGALQADIEVI